MAIIGKKISIADESLNGKFDLRQYHACTFYFENCRFFNFSFSDATNQNTIIFGPNNCFLEDIYINAAHVLFKQGVNMENVNMMKIEGKELVLAPSMELKANRMISLFSERQTCSNNTFSSNDSIRIQVAGKQNHFEKCKFYSEKGTMISMIGYGVLSLDQCIFQDTNSVVLSDADQLDLPLNGVSIICFREESELKIEHTKFYTNQLMLHHGNHVFVEDSQMVKCGPIGRITTENGVNHIRHVQSIFVPHMILDPLFEKETSKENKEKKKRLFAFLLGKGA